ncbi:MAG: hypothetical protein ABI528_02335 [bacterium]
MKKSSRILILILALSLIATYFVPLWNIALDAPQYPEGLGMQIWLNKITGDLNTINGLNHYIGMKTIQPDSIEELKLMPYIIGFIILFGFIVFVFNKKLLLLSWILIIVITGTVGMYDFWNWEYDYGHNLNPMAAIKVPGMNYQPPLIGSKQLLNFTATSLPDIGGFIIFAVGIIATLVLLYEYKYNKSGNVKI